VFTEILATTPIPEIEHILDDGWLAKVFDVYYPDGPERYRPGAVAPAASPYDFAERRSSTSSATTERPGGLPARSTAAARSAGSRTS
jgi:hypothetical protein